MADTANTNIINSDTVNGVETTNAADSIHPLPEQAAFVFSHALQGHMPLVLMDTETYHRMGEAGMFTNKRVELVGGTLLDMQPISQKHNYRVQYISEMLKDCLGKNATIFSQSPIRINDFSEPQPDIVVLRPPIERYSERHVQPDDILLIIEVARSTLRTDRTVKLELYARANIPEYWIVNLVDGQLETHRQPDTERGQYLATTIHYPDEKVAPKAFADCQLAWFS
jgi:Uma2 family endonuclease